MICYNCGLKVHSASAKECLFCGSKFGSFCRQCKAPNPAMSSFCCHCGSQLSNEKTGASVQNYSTLSESRKNVAILFADVSGFTSLSEKLDPELVREIINDCFSYITAPVYELGGTIDKYIGDCVMVLFGARTIHMDDAKRAVLCAIRMTELIRQFSEEKIKPLGFDLQLSIGVHFGLVVTGTVGNYFDMDYTVMGDTVNIAQRIQSNTPRSCIYVSEMVYKETHMDIQYDGPYTIQAKNKQNPIACYMPTAVINPLSSSREKVPMVGRHNCINQLADLVHQSVESCGYVIGISGPAGIGKSLLIEELLPHCPENMKIIKTECHPAYVNSPYSLISNMLMNIMNISPGESLIVKQSRIISYISFLMSKYDEEMVKRSYQFISFLMGIELDKETRDIITSMDTKSIYQEVANQLMQFFREFENRFHSFLIVEDMHWADEKSIALLKEIWANASNRGGHNIYLYTSRNEIDAFLDLSQEHHKHISLSSLGSDEVLEYVKLYMGCANVDKGFSDFVCSFSGGNPLYMYELLKYIKKAPLYHISQNTAYLERDIGKIPDSLSSLILSKLNYLSQEATELAQAASIVGKDFTLSVVNKLLGKDIERELFLKEAVNSNIIFPKTTFTYNGRMERLYSFAHETERETIYNSILNKKKVYYHRETAKAIEILYARNIESYHEVLGEHFEKGEEYIKASEYYSNAALHYKNLFNTQEALIYFQKAYNCFLKLRNPKTDSIYSLCMQIGELYSILSDFKNAKSFLNKALKNADNTNETWLAELQLARIYKDQSKYKEALKILDALQTQMKQSHTLYGSLLFLKCSIQRVIGQSQEALLNIKKAESILLKNKDYPNLAKVSNAAGIIYHTNSDIDNALKSYLKAYKYSEKTGDLQTLMKCAANMATIYHIQGNITSAMKYFNSAMELSKKISHRQGYITSCNNLGILYMDMGLFGKAKTLFEEAAKIAKETSTIFMQSAAMSNLADIEYYLGDYKAAKKHALFALEISKEIEDVEGEGINNIALAKISIEQNLLPEAKEYLQAAFAVYKDLNNGDGWSDYYYYLAQLHLEQQELQNAQEQVKVSLEHATKVQNTKKQSRALRLLGILQQELSLYDASVKSLDASIQLLEKEEAAFDLAKSLYLRALSHNRLGNEEAAQKDSKAALFHIKKIDKCKWTKIIEHGIS